MVIDRIENSEKYEDLGERISVALKHIRNAGFDNVGPGKYEIDGDRIFAIVSDYSTKRSDECRLEAHRKYLDVQYIAGGTEWIGFAPLVEEAVITKYDEAHDCAFYEGSASFVKLDEGMFAIFFPGELHMPGAGKKPSPVRKVVIKVKM